MCLGRFLIGCGSGLGFVCSTLVLYDTVPYASRPAHFLVLGLSFSFGTMMINLIPLLNISNVGILILASLISASCGIVYLLLHSQPSSNLENSKVEDLTNRTSIFPLALVYVLMAMNVSIGVPPILAFSKSVFEKFGLHSFMASALSISFPITQILLLFILYNFTLNRKILIIGGYTVAVLIQALLILTSFYPYLPIENQTIALSALFWLLAVTVSVPCNTALCLITEQFTSSNDKMKFASRGRCVKWILATLSTATFSWTLENYGFLICFVPYVIISTILLLILIRIYPHEN